ncbi:hypothetical protein SERLA73DRAFT_173639 [Serpula lacrymans var. lacrymans S7.3]|uniref:Uncharacterized protein n=2 Tax=Serpula lacrymans var. lacrymans TaxID=341189 RepID=F8PF94_SERL3|nr:uncharacterized protein SERLADRAFT_454433 [Serpula lacrymans var. lacrymans S7.9]EGO04200.1 hypothetical protein SERLA73DRAFT_173639 [Serpula lacrymans var. lacrymans S7.3]EGO30142.1 hypothetical protein SERLADRAFT_454433 [Serpula lacrymans var. lacrymans S7.9]
MGTLSEHYSCMYKIAPLEAMKSFQVLTFSEIGTFNKQFIPLLGEVMKDIWVPQLCYLKKFHEERSASMRYLGIVLIVVGVVLVLRKVGSVAARAAGFSHIGPVAGSMAARFQSSVYGATTGGIFSAIQSFAMTAVSDAVPVIVGGCMIAAGTILFRKSC